MNTENKQRIQRIVYLYLTVITILRMKRRSRLIDYQRLRGICSMFAE